MESKKFVIHGNPVGKPRMTQRDKGRFVKRFGIRPCVKKYIDWANSARSQAGRLPERPTGISLEIYIQMPDSWSKKKRAKMNGKYHQQTPDSDNILKSVKDALFKEDKTIAYDKAVKFWADRFPRIIVEVWRGDGY